MTPLYEFCTRIRQASPLPGERNGLACLAFGLLAVYLVVLPIGGTVALRNLAFFSLTVLTLWSVWRRGLRPQVPLAGPWLLYGAVALVSLTYAADPLWSLGEIKKEVGYGMLIMTLVATWTRSVESLEALVAILVASDVFQIGAVLVKCTALDPLWRHPISEIGLVLYNGAGKSLYNGVGNLSTYLVTVIPLIAAFALLQPPQARIKRIALFILIAFNVLALFLTTNRMGLIALMAEALVVVGFLTATRGGAAVRRILLATGILLPVLVGLEILQMHARTPEGDPRWGIWSFAINEVVGDPLRGGGFGRTVMVHSNPEFVQTFQLEHAHNTVLNKAVQMGLPGMAAFLLLLGAALHALWPRRSLHLDSKRLGYALAATAMFAGVFVKNMTDDFFVDSNALLYWALTGGILGMLAVGGSRLTRWNA
jgi:O-antigen ligase